MLKQSDHLANVDGELFNRVMEITKQIGDKEEHFNNLQTEYRKLASTWLLAALGACGYILQSTAALPFDHWFILFGIALAGSAGIAILWILDLRVYQVLLDTFFREGVRLETAYYKWLPPIRINIMRSQKTGDIRTKVQYYYFASITLLMIVGAVSVSNFKGWLFAERFTMICALLLFILVVLWVLIRQSKTSARQFQESEFGLLIREWQQHLEAGK